MCSFMGEIVIRRSSIQYVKLLSREDDRNPLMSPNKLFSPEISFVVQPLQTSSSLSMITEFTLQRRCLQAGINASSTFKRVPKTCK